jgi:hypothetical protein
LLTADDARGLQQLVAASGSDPSTFAFEVYQDLQTGATVILPQGETLSESGDLCVATSQGGAVTTRVKIEDTKADATGIATAIQFETQVMGLNASWFEQPQFSYLQPLPVVGGGMSVRKNWVQYLPFPGTMQFNFQQFTATQFETLALRGGALLGVTAFNSRWNPGVVQTQQACQVNSKASPWCAQALQDRKEWLESCLAVHLSTLAGTY